MGRQHRCRSYPYIRNDRAGRMGPEGPAHHRDRLRRGRVNRHGRPYSSQGNERTDRLERDRREQARRWRHRHVHRHSEPPRRRADHRARRQHADPREPCHATGGNGLRP